MLLGSDNMEKVHALDEKRSCPRCHKGVNACWSYCPICGEKLFSSTDEQKYVEKALIFAQEHGFSLEASEEHH